MIHSLLWLPLARFVRLVSAMRWRLACGIPRVTPAGDASPAFVVSNVQRLYARDLRGRYTHVLAPLSVHWSRRHASIAVSTPPSPRPVRASVGANHDAGSPIGPPNRVPKAPERCCKSPKRCATTAAFLEGWQLVFSIAVHQGDAMCSTSTPCRECVDHLKAAGLDNTRGAFTLARSTRPTLLARRSMRCKASRQASPCRA